MSPLFNAVIGVLMILAAGAIYYEERRLGTDLPVAVEPGNTAAASEHPPAQASALESSEPESAAPGAAPLRYLFDVDGHTLQEVIALLRRAEQMYLEAKPNPPVMTMIIHGPDVLLFARESYLQNKEMVDLAAKLQAYHVMDFKVCELSLQGAGLTPGDLPPFLEPIPFGPEEVVKLRSAGYVKM